MFPIFNATQYTLCRLVSGGLLQTTEVEPFQREEVALVRVVDVSQHYCISYKYSWVECEPERETLQV